MGRREGGEERRAGGTGRWGTPRNPGVAEEGRHGLPALQRAHKKVEMRPHLIGKGHRQDFWGVIEMCIRLIWAVAMQMYTHVTVP